MLHGSVEVAELRRMTRLGESGLSRGSLILPQSPAKAKSACTRTNINLMAGGSTKILFTAGLVAWKIQIYRSYFASHIGVTPF